MKCFLCSEPSDGSMFCSVCHELWWLGGRTCTAYEFSCKNDDRCGLGETDYRLVAVDMFLESRDA